jgi:hypothetical protein
MVARKEKSKAKDCRSIDSVRKRRRYKIVVHFISALTICVHNEKKEMKCIYAAAASGEKSI